ncbi:MAG: DUF4281 domain-containing protein [Pseudomonadales bacterium]|nr:DUF4281 domain-containing protein [Pseudomonadales bacterium]
MSPFDNELLFGSFTNLFVLGWLALLIGSFLNKESVARRYSLLIGGRVIPFVLLSAFVLGWALSRGLPGSIVSFEGVLLTNTVPEKVLAAWFEILGLALLVSRWMIDDSSAQNSPKLILVIGLVGAFVAAAIGLILYLALAHSWKKAKGIST